jgi:CheY-like chemotaxis protein
MTHEREGLFGLGGRRLLVVEDNTLCADAVRGWLEICGASVATVGSIDAALDRLRVETPDLLLVDLHLPDGSGWDLLERVRASLPGAADLPTVAITGFPADETAARRHGVRHVVTKPIAPEALADALNDCLAA